MELYQLLLVAVVARGTAVSLFKQLGEGHPVIKAHGPGNDGDGQIGGAQQLAGLLQFQVQQVLFRGNVVFFVKDPGQVVGVDAEVVGHLF